MGLNAPISFKCGFCAVYCRGERCFCWWLYVRHAPIGLNWTKVLIMNIHITNILVQLNPPNNKYNLQDYSVTTRTPGKKRMRMKHKILRGKKKTHTGILNKTQCCITDQAAFAGWTSNTLGRNHSSILWSGGEKAGGEVGSEQRLVF